MPAIPHRASPLATPRSPHLRTLLAVVATVAASLVAAPHAGATKWTVELANGNAFDTRYQPEEASWDASIVLLLTEQGNLIALDRAEVARVSTDTEDRGFGTVIDDKTIALGVLPNDAAVPEAPGAELSTAQVLQQLIQQQQAAPQPNYSVEQFVDPGQAGGGLPVGYASGVPPAPQTTTVPVIFNP